MMISAINRPIVAFCKFCGIGLTVEELAELKKHTQGGMRYACNHGPAARRAL